MSNTPKPAAPKTVVEIVDETTVPAQATAEKTVKEPKVKVAKPQDSDEVLGNDGRVVFSGTSEEVLEWLNDGQDKVYVIRPVGNRGDLMTSLAYEKKYSDKGSLVQRAKAAAEKLKQNKKALMILGGAAVVVGLTIKNNRKAVSVEPLDEAEGPVNGRVEPVNPDETPDSL